jgi:hypothetical protein
MIVFNDYIYAADNGGIIRSTSNDPQPPGVLGPGASFTTVTPSTSIYTKETSISLTRTSDLEPADKAFPQMAVLAGRLYAARNTNGGPQLFVCNPGSDGLCSSSEWTQLAPNSVNDPKISQFNDGNNKSVTMLVATSAHLYVGFNNANGVRIFRSTTTTPATRSEFEGAGGCNAANAPTSCDGLGTSGLGAAATRIFDARAITYGGIDYVYVTAGNGTSGFRVFRLAL